MPDNSTALVAIDWGTSSLRGARLNAQGQVLEEISLARGILTVPAGGFDALFDELFGGWLQQAGPEPCLISGMAGSREYALRELTPFLELAEEGQIRALVVAAELVTDRLSITYPVGQWEPGLIAGAQLLQHRLLDQG